MNTLKFNQFLNEANAENNYAAFFASMLEIRAQAHMYHWQTTEHSVHIALEKFYNAYIILIDSLAEAILGFGDRPVLGEATLSLNDYSKENVQDFIKNAETLFKESGLKIANGKGEVINIIDEIIAELDKLKYLLTLS